MGGNFLEYGVFPLMIPAAEKHAWGIDGIGVGVTLCVMATIIAILDALARRKGSNEQLSDGILFIG